MYAFKLLVRLVCVATPEVLTLVHATPRTRDECPMFDTGARDRGFVRTDLGFTMCPTHWTRRESHPFIIYEQWCYEDLVLREVVVEDSFVIPAEPVKSTR